MNNESNTTTSVLLHRIKTSLYALSAIIFAGWVTDALNEDLMFRIVTRYFFPDAVAKYEHPLDSLRSFLLWGVPLSIGLLLMLVAAVIAVHHIKKRHVYALRKTRKTVAVKNILLAAEADRLQEALTTYSAAEHIHIISTIQEKHTMVEATAKAFEQNKNRTIRLHTIPDTKDMYALAKHLSLLIKNISSKEDELAFDIHFTSSLLSCAAMYCSLDVNMTLTYPVNESIIQYETEECMTET